MKTFLKYEFKESWKEYLISYIIMFGAFLLLSVFVNCMRLIKSPNNFLIIIYFNLIALVFLAMTGSWVLFIINIVKGSYMKIFGDEGYLTLSLPRSTDALILSKIIANIIWAILYTCVCLIGMVILLFSIQGIDLEFIKALKELLIDLFSVSHIILLEMINVLLLLVLTFIVLMLSFTIINLSTLKKGKIMLGIIIFMTMESAINSLLSLTDLIGFGFTQGPEGKLIFATGYPNFDVISPNLLGNSPYVINFTFIIFAVGLIVGGYFLIRYLLDKKIELE